MRRSHAWTVLDFLTRCHPESPPSAIPSFCDSLVCLKRTSVSGGAAVCAFWTMTAGAGQIEELGEAIYVQLDSCLTPTRPGKRGGGTVLGTFSFASSMPVLGHYRRRSLRTTPRYGLRARTKHQSLRMASPLLRFCTVFLWYRDSTTSNPTLSNSPLRYSGHRYQHSTSTSPHWRLYPE